LVTYRLDLAYLGGGFHGWAAQPGVRTVQGEVERALNRITGQEASLAVAGRTDAGVHAGAQVASFQLPELVLESKVVNGLNSMLGPEVAVVSCRLVEDRFDARFSACWRSYRYRVLTTDTPDPFQASTSWHYPGHLDLAAMNSAVHHLVGEHDFASFCRVPPGGTARRRVLDAGWSMGDDQIAVLAIAATSFCHQMVRSVAGLSTEVGKGRADPAAVPEIIEKRDRAAARRVAPPHGLTLWRVGYREWPDE
jgi:tRNA pseudouridine38-40 synthase